MYLLIDCLATKQTGFVDGAKKWGGAWCVAENDDLLGGAEGNLSTYQDSILEDSLHISVIPTGSALILLGWCFTVQTGLGGRLIPVDLKVLSTPQVLVKAWLFLAKHEHFPPLSTAPDPQKRHSETASPWEARTRRLFPCPLQEYRRSPLSC